jgi:hypothetical protein
MWLETYRQRITDAGKAALNQCTAGKPGFVYRPQRDAVLSEVRDLAAKMDAEVRSACEVNTGFRSRLQQVQHDIESGAWLWAGDWRAVSVNLMTFSMLQKAVLGKDVVTFGHSFWKDFPGAGNSAEGGASRDGEPPEVKILQKEMKNLGYVAPVVECPGKGGGLCVDVKLKECAGGTSSQTEHNILKSIKTTTFLPFDNERNVQAVWQSFYFLQADISVLDTTSDSEKKKLNPVAGGRHSGLPIWSQADLSIPCNELQKAKTRF